MLIFFQLLLLLISLFLFLQNHNSSDNGEIGALTITINHNLSGEKVSLLSFLERVKKYLYGPQMTLKVIFTNSPQIIVHIYFKIMIT